MRILLAALFALASIAAAADRPNIIFIVVDDMGVYDVGAYGSRAVRTPHLDRMAAEGMLFTQAYSGCTVCAPARSTLMTGAHMGHTSVRGNTGGVSLRAEDVTVAEVLKKAGYATGGFGKWGLGDIDTPGVPERNGFDRFFGYYHQVHAHYFYPDYLIDSGTKVPLPGNIGFYDSKPKPGAFGVIGPNGKKREFTAHRIFDEMKQWIRENKGGPFFCYAPWTPPHARYELPETDPAWQQYKRKPWPINAKVHAAFCSMMDRNVGETIALLEELGIADDTIIFFCSDNGASDRFEGSLNSAGPYQGFKRSMYEGGIRTPFLARWPGKIQAGSTSDLPTYFPDFMPTAAELAGAAEHVPEGIDGMSIVAELLGASKLDRERHMYWEWERFNWKT
ncbi:MAG: arylsulfatase, partial [bacterium]|nr:arylsulfatase [bacterium]